MTPIVAFLTDFGTRDAYVAAMKGVVLGICPGAQLVDITHAVPAQDVRAGALVLRDAAPFFPVGTVFVAVVDPGVGSARRGVAVGAGGRFLVGPDNGLLEPAAETLAGLARDGGDSADVVVVDLGASPFRRPEVSSTFHGRDVFAPIGAHLAAGVGLFELGEGSGALQTLALPEPRREAGHLVGEVVYVDHFGNLVTNVPGTWLGAGVIAHVGAVGAEVAIVEGLSRSYVDVEPGRLLLVVGSSGFLEVSVSMGSAATALGVGVGSAVRVVAGLR